MKLKIKDIIKNKYLLYFVAIQSNDSVQTRSRKVTDL